MRHDDAVRCGERTALRSQFAGVCVKPRLISAAALSASAAMVKVGGFTPAVGKTIPPTMNRLAWSCARKSRSTTD